MKFIVDRIEGEYAVCEAENRSMTNIPISELPPGTKEGDHIGLEEGVYTILTNDDGRKRHIQGLMDDLWN